MKSKTRVATNLKCLDDAKPTLVISIVYCTCKAELLKLWGGPY